MDANEIKQGIYDAIVELPEKRHDMSTGRVGTTFTLPMFDGRIFLPTDEPLTPGADVAPRITAGPPAALRTVTLDDSTTVVQTPGGLEIPFNQMLISLIDDNAGPG